jgi:hypothetical protein
VRPITHLPIGWEIGNGASPLSLFSEKADGLFVATLRARWQKIVSRRVG